MLKKWGREKKKNYFYFLLISTFFIFFQSTVIDESVLKIREIEKIINSKKQSLEETIGRFLEPEKLEW